eukprot:TRINITY_DN4405_c0_g1_i2.p1 TRINITY_DN4405_c0_g1~~TRINITY_DN4405_c0_g1_i2.p1  ORF type:complete len:665 (-),score=175.19 TRINITY_DN4405_c0_g1_i2:72-2024(-)
MAMDMVKEFVASNACGVQNPINGAVGGMSAAAGGQGGLAFMPDRWRVAAPKAPVAPMSPQEMTDILHAFIHASLRNEPLPQISRPDPGIPFQEQAKIMKRSEILARQIGADKPPEFMHAQLGSMFGALHIEPEAVANYDSGWDVGEYGDTFEGAWGGGAGPATRMHHAPPSAWADEFAPMAAQMHAPPNAWAEEFAPEAVHSGPDPTLAPNGDWIQQFEQSGDVDTEAGLEDAWSDASKAAPLDPAQAAAEKARLREATDRLYNAVDDPRIKNSRFMQLMGSLSKGEVEIKDNDIVPAAPGGDGWASEFAGGQAKGGDWASEFGAVDGVEGTARAYQGTEDSQPWDEEYALQEPESAAAAAGFDTTEQQKSGDGQALADEYAAESFDGSNWADDFAKEAGPASSGAVGEYAFADDASNPFLSHAAPLSKGIDLYQAGNVADAILAFEAEIKHNPENAKAWQLTGLAHAENDNDTQATAALCKANELEPGNPETLMALAVSCTNDFSKDRAVTALKQWLQANPKYAHIREPPAPAVGNTEIDHQFANLMTSFTSHIQTLEMFLQAARQSPEDVDPEVQTALGLLFNLSYEYDKAVDCLKAALSKRTTDHLLWNKLGATLANSNNNADALEAYQVRLTSPIRAAAQRPCPPN